MSSSPDFWSRVGARPPGSGVGGHAVAQHLAATERSAWLAPGRDDQRVRSWTAMAGANDGSVGNASAE